MLVFDNARLFDGTSAEIPDGMSVLVEGDRIREIADRPIPSASARRIDLAGRLLMPGMIDLHVHAYAASLRIDELDRLGAAYRTAYAVRMLGHALESGFTTVRDVGGGDQSLARAIADGLIVGPRFFHAGKAITVTGGHLDLGGHGDTLCGCGRSSVLGVVADGVAACIHVARDQFRLGAHCIKIVGSGGVASPGVPIWLKPFRDDEISAIVGECHARRSYATAHCHSADAVRQVVRLGVRCIEHATMIDDETAAAIVDADVSVVPTVAILREMAAVGQTSGLDSTIMDKLAETGMHALHGLERLRDAGARIGFGSDLIGPLHHRRCREFRYRREVFSPIELLRQATSNAAAILGCEGTLGCIVEGALADLLAVDADPFADIGVLDDGGSHLPVIVRGGAMIRDRL